MFKKITSFTTPFLLLSLLFLGNIDTFANSLISIETNQLLNEELLGLKDENKLSKEMQNDDIKMLSENFVRSYEGSTNTVDNDKKLLDLEIQKIENTNNLKFLAIKNSTIDKNSNLSKTEKRASKQINKIIFKYINSNFGENKNVLNLDNKEKNQLESFIDNSTKIQKLSSII